MRHQDDTWLIEEEPFDDEPSELIHTMPEIRHYVDADQRDDESWIRSVLERPEALSEAWSRHVDRRRRKKRRHGAAVLRAA